MRVLVDGRRIGYDDSGGPGAPLVLLHGFPLERSLWDEQLGALEGNRVIRVDLRGCGESDPSEGPALMEALAGDVAGVLDAAHVERAGIAGHSLGGYVALAFFRMYAERVSGLALIASSVAADGAPEVRAGRDALAARLEREGTMGPAVESYLPRYFAPRVYRERPDLASRARALIERQNPSGCAQLVRGMKERLDSHDLLADVDVPALVLAGGEDAILPAEALREFAAAMRAEFVLLPESGHLPMWEAPETTAEALAAFAQRLRV